MLLESLSILPFIILIYFFIIKQIKAYKVMFVNFILTSIIIYFFWNVEFMNIFFSSIKGFLIGFEIFLIIFGAIILFKIIEFKKNLLVIENFFKNITHDKNLQLLLIGFLLVAFFEGIAGFGIPAVICAPILIYLGFKKIPAVVVCLTSDAFTVSFGAFGTPILYGIKEGAINSNTQEVAFLTSFILGILMIFLPFFLLFIYDFLTEKNFSNLKKYFSISFFMGFTFASIYFITASFFSLQLPSVIASIFSLIIFIFFIKKNKIKNKIKIFQAFLPYIFLVFLLIIIRFNFLYLNDLFSKISYTFNPINFILYTFNFTSLGILLFLTSLIFLFSYKLNNKQKKQIILHSINKTKITFLTLIFTLMFVQVLLISNYNNLNILGIPQIIANFFSQFEIFYLFISPLIGAFGAFLSGSVTVSNLIFSQIQYDIALLNTLPLSLVLALQVIGGSIGNLISIQNLIAVSSVVDLHHQEHKLFKINFFIVLGFCFLSSVIAFLIYFL